MGNNNSNLRQARKAKNDEFYTQLVDIEKELVYYTEQLYNKIVYCPFDDYRISNFVKYFKDNFTKLKLKKLIATNYNIGTGAYKYEYDGINETITKLEGNGDFESDECTKIKDECDIIISNPPFSKFRSVFKWIMDNDSKFLIIGNLNAVTYKEIFPLIKENKVWMGVTCFNGGATHFIVPSELCELYDADKMFDPKNAYFENGKFMRRVNGVRWFTNIENKRHQTSLDIYKKYTPEEYPKYDNCDAIEVSKTAEIPIDYDGVMGVPITLLDKYCPEQFEILGIANSARWIGDFSCYTIINGQKIYNRILIKRK